MSLKNQHRVVVRAIIVANGKVLLGKRRRGVGKDQFALIGGKPDGKEAPQQAVAREVLEETGLEFESPVLRKKVIDRQSVPGEHWRVYFFVGRAKGKLKLKNDEVVEVVYVGKTDLPDFDIAFNHREILTDFFNETTKI